MMKLFVFLVCVAVVSCAPVEPEEADAEEKRFIDIIIGGKRDAEEKRWLDIVIGRKRDAEETEELEKREADEKRLIDIIFGGKRDVETRQIKVCVGNFCVPIG
ncbi:uncharacterized protein LOC121368050 isoform X2 [Gigantopelta aegis]|uniref:uncharacterized protein LOC121368050 isoform X2 n=1 Tax=Gigantopelta aegis TaxID=1735272 RepID=UPI001B88E639|nr:uncharacterized protein LOC121368050 isoform X2 [Gigantopelta aegis]